DRRGVTGSSVCSDELGRAVNLSREGWRGGRGRALLLRQVLSCELAERPANFGVHFIRGSSGSACVYPPPRAQFLLGVLLSGGGEGRLELARYDQTVLLHWVALKNGNRRFNV
uniref:Uncharacterized protein n=1 Tax=Leersia perrieri TaxID=77586 RepID=A0A0D9W4Y4_9ORYZ